MDSLLVIAPISGLISILVAIYLYYHVKKQDSGTPKMREISNAIREGAIAYLKREYKTLSIFVLILAVLITFALGEKGPRIALAYVIGSICSALAGFIGMDIALKANVRTTSAARKGLKEAFPVGFYAGAVMGLSVVGLALIGISLIYLIYNDPEIVLGFSFGASSIALFAKAGGGIYTKTADIGADLVGKIEMDMPEDDPRNPAVIADNVGDNVGDVAGMGADLFDSYVASIVAAMIIGMAVLGVRGVILPLIFAATGIFASIIGTSFVRVRKQENPGNALNRGTYITCAIFAILTYLMMYYLNFDINIFYATLAGLIVGIIIGITSDYYTSIEKYPALKTAEASKTGAAINILTGYSFGLISIVPVLIGIGIATIVAYNFAGLFGISMAAVGMLSITGMVVSNDAYGPIVDNAKGIAELKK